MPKRRELQQEKICKVIKITAKELNLPEDLIKNTYMSYWKIVKDSIQSIPLKDINTDQIKEYKTSINIPSLGKFTCNINKFITLKENRRVEDVGNT